MDAHLGHQAGIDVEPGLPHAGLPGRGEIVDADLVDTAGEDRGVALVMSLVNQCLPLEVHRRAEGVFIRDFVRVLLDFDFGKIDREGGEHAELQIQIARAV